jgi:hypothetical protein
VACDDEDGFGNLMGGSICQLNDIPSRKKQNPIGFLPLLERKNEG